MLVTPDFNLLSKYDFECWLSTGISSSEFEKSRWQKFANLKWMQMKLWACNNFTD